MKICGKALPPRAALLLSLDFFVLVLLAPSLFVVPLIAVDPSRSTASLLLSLLRLMSVGLLCQAIFYYHELYNLQVVRESFEVFTRLLRAFAFVFLVLALALVVLPIDTPVLPKTFLFSAVVGIIVLLSRELALPRRREQVVVLGVGDEVAEVQEVIRMSPEWNMEVSELIHPSHLGLLLSHEGSSEHFDRMIVANPQIQPAQNLSLLLDLKMKGMPIEDAQSFFERATGRVCLEQLDTHACIFSDGYAHRASKRWAKRLFDVVVASVLLALAAPLMGSIALLIWIQGDGPVFFRQQRTGLFGRSFEILKFRSMSPVGVGERTGWAGNETHRITKLGAHLRKYRIDELPQLWNVLKGDMSLVGPRPEQPHLCALLEEHIPFYRYRHAVPPGLTGWAQVRYHYGSSIEESRRKSQYDLFYVKHLSVWLDFAIVLETVKVVLVGRGAI